MGCAAMILTLAGVVIIVFFELLRTKRALAKHIKTSKAASEFQSALWKGLNERLVALEIEVPHRPTKQEPDIDPASTWQRQRQRAEQGAAS